MKLFDYLIDTSYRALIYDSLEEYLEVIEDLTRYLDEHPQNSAAYNNRGMAYLEIGEYQNALDDFSKAIEVDPSNEVHFRNRAYQYKILNEPERAAEDQLTAEHLKDRSKPN